MAPAPQRAAPAPVQQRAAAPVPAAPAPSAVAAPMGASPGGGKYDDVFTANYNLIPMLLF